MCVLGMAEEYKKDGVLVNALWPRTGEVGGRKKEGEIWLVRRVYFSKVSYIMLL